MTKILFLLSLFICVLYGFESYNYVDKDYKITQVKELKEIYSSKISPYFDKQELKYFNSFDGIKIAYKKFIIPNAKGIIVISSGRSEGMIKYKELIYDFNRNGYSVYIHDHRGQGYSQRLLEDSQIGHVNDFFDYVKDLKYFVDKYVDTTKKLFLVSHSMGGAIASLYVEQYKKDFKALVLSSPMHQPLVVSSGLTNIICTLVGSRESVLYDYSIGGSSYDERNMDFNTNIYTHSKTRYDIMRNEYTKNPETKLGSPSTMWVSEACRAGKLSVKEASEVVIPTLLLQPENEKKVNAKPQEEFCKNSYPYCRGIKLDKAYHELFIEKDIIRNKALSAIFDFLSKI